MVLGLGVVVLLLLVLHGNGCRRRPIKLCEEILEGRATALEVGCSGGVHEGSSSTPWTPTSVAVEGTEGMGKVGSGEAVWTPGMRDPMGEDVGWRGEWFEGRAVFPEVERTEGDPRTLGSLLGATEGHGGGKRVVGMTLRPHLFTLPPFCSTVLEPDL